MSNQFSSPFILPPNTCASSTTMRSEAPQAYPGKCELLMATMKQAPIRISDNLSKFCKFLMTIVTRWFESSQSNNDIGIVFIPTRPDHLIPAKGFATSCIEFARADVRSCWCFDCHISVRGIVSTRRRRIECACEST